MESAGIREGISALLGNSVGGAVNFVATLFVLFFVSLITSLSQSIVLMHYQIDKWDRRRILVFGAFAMGACMLCITIVSAIYNQRLVDNLPIYGSTYQTTSTITNTQASYAILALLCLFLAFFALSW